MDQFFPLFFSRFRISLYHELRRMALDLLVATGLNCHELWVPPQRSYWTPHQQSDLIDIAPLLAALTRSSIVI